jgi:hypothetical protein
MKNFKIIFIALLIFSCTKEKNLVSIPSISSANLLGYWERTEFGFFNAIIFKKDSTAIFDKAYDEYKTYKYFLKNDSICLKDHRGKVSSYHISKLTKDSLIIDNFFNFENKFVYIKFVPEKPLFFENGKEDAIRDIKNDSLIVKTYGLPASWFSEYQRIFKEEYNVLIEPIAGCIVTKDLREYVSEYNEVSKQRIKQLYGNDIFDIVRKKAQASPNPEYEKIYLDSSFIDSIVKRFK